MKKFTQILESRNAMSHSAAKIMQKEIAEYSKRMAGKIPEDVVLATALINKYSIFDQDTVKGIVSSTKSDMRRIADELSIDLGDAEQLQFLMKKIDKEGNLRLIPVMMTKSEREDLEAGRKALDDVTMDLETDRGRNAVAKLYAPLVMSIAGKFVGKSGLDRSELISAGLEGLTIAMNTYRRPGTEEIDNLEIEDDQKKEGAKVKGLTFRQYAGWCIRNRILSEINQNSRTVRINNYAYKKMKREGDISRSFIASIDQMGGDSEEGGTTDRIPELGEEPEVFKRDQSKDEERYKELCKIIEARFPMKKAVIFYKIFGLNGEKETSARTIGAEMGMSEQRIAQVKKEILLYLRSNPKAMEMLGMLREMYTEHLISDLCGLSKDQVYEALLSDDFYILLETVTKWDSKDRLTASISTALEDMLSSDADYIVKCLRDGFEFIDSSYRKNKETIVEFLSAVEPTETFGKRSDAYIIDRLTELSNMCKKHNIYQK
jgi:RNA polymerase sigma factor (sigma-70 family)